VRTWKLGEICEHDTLGRKCEICERDDDIQELACSAREVLKAIDGYGCGFEYRSEFWDAIERMRGTVENHPAKEPQA
jgi:hypothetical protein